VVAISEVATTPRGPLTEWVPEAQQYWYLIATQLSQLGGWE